VNDHSTYSVVFGGNRDEFYSRPTAEAATWDEAPHVLGGRDRKAGGTWMGVTRSGHWAVVTNVRDPEARDDRAPSRGQLAAQYLIDEPDPKAYRASVRADADRYNGFNLLIGTPTTLHYVSNRPPRAHAVSPGLHGLSNAHLDSDWPKVARAKSKLHSLLKQDSLDPNNVLDLLHDRRRAPAEALPDTGVGPEVEQFLSPIFIDGEEYGTRASTVLLIDEAGEVTFAERTYNHGQPTGTQHFTFDIAPVPRP
jgi:uncharacterized protein with NRDE domain